MVADGRVAALWGGGIGWPGFTAVMKAGGRFIGLTPDEVAKVTRQAQFPETDHRAGRRLRGPEGAGEFGRLVELHPGAADLPDDVAYRLAKALHHGHAALVKRLDQARETTPQSTAAAAPSAPQIHPGVQRICARSAYCDRGDPRNNGRVRRAHAPTRNAMGYLMAGVIISLASLGGLKLSLPTADGQLRSFLKNGTDTGSRL